MSHDTNQRTTKIGVAGHKHVFCYSITYLARAGWLPHSYLTLWSSCFDSRYKKGRVKRPDGVKLLLQSTIVQKTCVGRELRASTPSSMILAQTKDK